MSFIFGGDTNITAAQAQRQRELANMFVQQMANERVARNAPEGVVSLANSLASMIAGNRATRSEQKLQGEASKQFSDLLANLDSPSMSPTGTGRATGQRSLSFSDAGQSPSDSLINAVIKQESGGDPNAVSPAGAQGLMQIMPDTAANPGFGMAPLQDPFNADANKAFGTEYLGKMIDRYGGDIPRALVAYNWGPGNADKWDGDMGSLPEETRNYVRNITNDLGSISGQPQQMAQAAPRETGPSYNRIRQFGTLLANPYLGAGEKAVVQSMMDAEVKKLSADPLDDEMKRLQMDNIRSQMDARNTPKPIAIEREYQLAQQGGYDGSFADYVQYRKGKGIEIGPDGTVRIGGGVKKATEGQSKANIYATRMEASNKILDDLEGEGTELSSLLASGVPIAGNYLLDEDYRKYSQAQRDFINAALRQESGAVISEQEFANARQQYFPQPGDGPETIAQKRQNRIIAMEAIRDASGPFDQGGEWQDMGGGVRMRVKN